MTDPGREVPLHAGETTYILYAGNRALRVMERETGKNLFELVNELERYDEQSNDAPPISMELVTTIVWAMLQRSHPDLSLDDVDDVIDGAGYDAVMTAMGEAITHAFPTAAGAGVPGKASGRNGTGKRSLPARSRPASASRNSGH